MSELVKGRPIPWNPAWGLPCQPYPYHVSSLAAELWCARRREAPLVRCEGCTNRQALRYDRAY